MDVLYILLMVVAFLVLAGVYKCLDSWINGDHRRSFRMPRRQGVQVEVAQPENSVVVEPTAPKIVLPMTHSLPQQPQLPQQPGEVSGEGDQAPPPSYENVMARAPPLNLEYDPQGPDLDLSRSNLRKTL
eukprot:sb/3475316/